MTDALRCEPIANLRQRAVKCALTRLERHGEDGLSLRAIAADLGTGVGSLYYHFASKEALLAELAVDGFRELERWMAIAPAAQSQRTPFNAAGHAYLGFIRHRPELYALMFSERLRARHEQVRRAESGAFEVFRASLENLGVPEAEVADLAFTFWALGRGIASAAYSRGDREPGADKPIVQRVLRGLSTLTNQSLAFLAPTRQAA